VVRLEDCFLERLLKEPAHIADLTTESCWATIIEYDLANLGISLSAKMKRGEKPSFGKLPLDIR
jgi:hypothetical protein